MSDVAGLVHQRRRRSRVEAEQLVREYEASDLTRQAFCAERGLSVAALDKYRQQHRTGVGAGRMIAVEVLAEPVARLNHSSSALWLELPKGRRIGVGSGFDAATLERLLAVLEQA